MSLLISCGSQVSDLELRVAKLETEIASMRKGGGITSVVPAGAYPQFAFQEEEYNFGDIRDGEIVSHVFKFNNTLTSSIINIISFFNFFNTLYEKVIFSPVFLL